MTPITQLTVESAPKALWREFLESYFDGAAHDVGAHAAVVFPKAGIAFGQSPARQPLDAADNPAQPVQTSAEIRVLCLPRSSAATWNSSADAPEHQLATDAVTFQFQVRVVKPRPQDAEALADRLSELLHALLIHPDTRYPLARHGITHLQPNKPVTIESGDWHLRLVHCAAQLQYPVLLSGTTPAAAVVTTLAWQSLPFFRESPLVPGETVPGIYSLPFACTLTTVQLSCWPGLTDTVLTLEVNGVLTDRTITIPGGPPLVETTRSATLNLPVAASATLQWRITSGPATVEDAAWHLALTLQTKP